MNMAASGYARMFDDSCKGWNRDRDINLMFLKYIQQYCNDLLKVRGYIFLRDVYEMIGIPLSRESCLVGWIYEENNPIGDNYVDFQITDDPTGSPNVLLDFNVDGEIINRL